LITKGRTDGFGGLTVGIDLTPNEHHIISTFWDEHQRSAA